MMRKNLAIMFAAIILAAGSAQALAADGRDTDTDTRLVSAKVVEVTDARISVIARTGVEHVIAIDDASTKVMLEGKHVSIKDLREGDIVTVELDEVNPLKFARHIDVAAQSNSQVAKAKP